jgi:hypothetical protein
VLKDKGENKEKARSGIRKWKCSFTKAVVKIFVYITSFTPQHVAYKGRMASDTNSMTTTAYNKNI